mmetsp:Transcript_53477/g.174026  ORF Transcript_53477/g.174026 Transcript_53477/m.174026 type:complete len:281 (-) Transcript_53477:1197-2039(-)
MCVQALEEDGTSDLVGLDTGRLHLLDDAPNLGTLSGRATSDEPVDEFVESHTVRLQALAPHLLHERPCFGEVQVLEVCLDQRVVRHDIDEADAFRLCHPCLCCRQIPTLHTSIKHRVVHNAVHLGAAALEGLENLHGTNQVAGSRTIPDHRDVLRNIGRRRIQEVFRQVVAATAESCTHQATLDASIEADCLLQWLTVTLRRARHPQALEMLLVHVASFIVLLAVCVEADKCGEDRNLLRFHVLEERICEFHGACLRAKGQQRQGEVRGEHRPLGNHLVE